MSTTSINAASISAGEDTTSAAIDLSGVAKPHSVGVEFSVTCSTDMDGDARLKVLGSLDGTTFSSVGEGRPLATISNVATATVVEVTDFINTGFEEIKFYVENTDISNAITVTVKYTTNAL